MEFKYINDRHLTPQSDPSVFSSSSTTNCERYLLPHNISTPPSRYSKIINPFECRLLDRLHLPTFSPSVFASQSTPSKTDGNFKWTIDDISSLKPADIDEGTISQHVFDEDPTIESLVQQKIDEFFSEKVIVPSPIGEIVRIPLITESPVTRTIPKECSDFKEGSTQTMLSLPPILPAHVEEILKPYFLSEVISEPKKNRSIKEMKNSSLYRNLFKNCDSTTESTTDESSPQSPALSLIFSPINSIAKAEGRHSPGMHDLHECSLSPIGEKDVAGSPKEMRSAVRLDFMSKISMEASFTVPDIGNELSNNSVFLETSNYYPQPPNQLNDSSVNWDMEHEQVSLISPNSSTDSNQMDISNANTPNSKLFTSQRKRLSHSFNIEEGELIKGNESGNNNKQSRKSFINRYELTDPGYHTGIQTFSDETSIHMFASTPTKLRRN